jgi:hypothetical protein
MTNVEGRKPEGAPERSPKAGAGAASGVDGNVAKRFSVQRKMAVVARMLRGEPLEAKASMLTTLLGISHITYTSRRFSPRLRPWPAMVSSTRRASPTRRQNAHGRCDPRSTQTKDVRRHSQDCR